MFSVVIPLYNKEKTIERAIASVLRQTLQDFEIVVVDDGSTDGGSQVVQRIQDARIRLIYQENEGVSAARNRGIAEARFDLIAFIDADDEWKQEFLETVARLVHDFPEAAVFATSYLFCESGGEIRQPRVRGISLYPWEGIIEDYFAVAAQSDPPIWSSAVAIRKDALLAVGGFPVGVTSGEDLLTWARLALRYEIAFSTAPLAVFHLGDTVPASSLRRLPNSEDPVGKELRQMLDTLTHRRKRSFRHYIALWNKMQASVMLRASMGRYALKHALLATFFWPLNWRNYPLVMFSVLPASFGSRAFGIIINARQRRRDRGRTSLRK